MSDFETLRTMFKDRGIAYDDAPDRQGLPNIVVEGGYTGFYTSFTFDKDGKLTSIEAYE